MTKSGRVIERTEILARGVSDGFAIRLVLIDTEMVMDAKGVGMLEEPEVGLSRDQFE